MLSKPLCQHLYVAGPKKGQRCNRFCRAGGDLCGTHKPRLCPHNNREKSKCKDCGGSQICEHNRRKSRCKECGGGSICEHNKEKSHCKECGGSQICEHNRIKSICKDCGGGSICEHNKQKSHCKECDPKGHLRCLVSRRIHHALHENKIESSIEYLGCDIETFRQHIESKFEEGMSWDNYGDWEIDHIIPIKFNDPTLKQVIARLHYSNTQPLWKEDNNKKLNNYCVVNPITRMLIKWIS